MKKKYLKYQVEDFLSDEEVFNSIKNDAHKNSWSKWLSEHPEMEPIYAESLQLAKSFQFEETPFENKSKVWDRIAQSTSAKEVVLNPSIKRNWTVWISAAAASIALLFFVYSGPIDISDNDDINTSIADQIVKLPNGSIVTLIDGGTIDYDDTNWDKERNISLKGAASFDVTKGVPFTVSSDNGSVQVLGTKFTIHDYDDSYKVDVEEGKVKVNSGNKSQILTANMSYRKNQKNTVEDTKNAIVFYQFEAKPMEQVLNSLEQSFEIEIDVNDQIIRDKNYTGLYSNENLKDALQSVLWPMNLKYTIEGDLVIISEE